MSSLKKKKRISSLKKLNLCYIQSTYNRGKAIKGNDWTDRKTQPLAIILHMCMQKDLTTQSLVIDH